MKKALLLLIIIFTTLPLFAQKEAATLNKKGVDLGNSGQFIEATQNFDKSISIYDKEAAKTIHNIGWLYELKKEPQNAILFYEEALRRNPDQLHTLERAGFIHYSLKNYEKAILYGEKVMKLDPLNKEVIVWLPDAYAQMFKMRQEVISQSSQDQEKKKVEEQIKDKKAEEKKLRKYITVAYEATLRTTYLRAGGDGFHYTKTDAYGYNVPNMVYLDVTPVDSFEFKANTGVPYYGALLDSPISWTEKAEAVFYKKVYFLGLGFMGNHYKEEVIPGETIKLSDYKMGIVFGKYEDSSRLEISFYPRMFPADTGTASGYSLDVDCLDISYWLLLQNNYKLYWKFSLNDFYYFDNTVPDSMYYGMYSFTFGIGTNDSLSNPYVIRFDIIERMYLENYNDKRPYAFMNGQGIFGLDAYQWFKGKPMSGIKTFTTGFSLYAEERLVPRFFVYQRLTAEIVGKKQYGNDFCFTFGMGGYY
jgi:tetratricopeptide (TPR) repeat protein